MSKQERMALKERVLRKSSKKMPDGKGRETLISNDAYLRSISDPSKEALLGKSSCERVLGEKGFTEKVGFRELQCSQDRRCNLPLAGKFFWIFEAFARQAYVRSDGDK